MVTVAAERAHIRVPALVHVLHSPVPFPVRVVPCLCPGLGHPGLYHDRGVVQGHRLLDVVVPVIMVGEEKIRIEVDAVEVVGVDEVYHPVTGISAIVVPDLVPHPHVAVVVVVVAVTPLVVDHRATLAVDTAALRGTTIVEIEIDLTDLRIEVEEAEEEVVVEVVVHEDDRSRVHSPHVPGLLVLDPQGAVRRVILFALVALGQGP